MLGSEQTSSPGAKVLRTIKFERKVEVSSDPITLPIPRDEIFPARHLILKSKHNRDKVLNGLIANNPCEYTSNGKFKVVRDADGNPLWIKNTEIADDSEELQVVHLRPLPTKPKKRKVQRNPKESSPKAVIYPFMRDLAYHKNPFIFLRAHIHPLLHTYSFENISNLLSCIWNDHESCNASDYFMYLAMCTAITPDSYHNIPQYTQLIDNSGYKVLRMPFAEAIRTTAARELEKIEANETSQESE